MKLPSLVLTLAAVQTAIAHTIFTTLYVDDVDQGDGTCIRMPLNPSTATDPINDLTSTDMACNVDGTTGVARVCPTKQGSKLSFVFREWADASQPGVIDVSHKGPCAVYMKPVSSAIQDGAAGDGWFKIFDEGYDSSTSQWCTEKLMNGTLLAVDIPSDLAGGYYLVRPELLALQQADKTPPNPQFYAGCAQIFLQSTGTAVPQSTVSIPGYVTINDPSVLFNIYNPHFPYPMVGPAVYESSTSSKRIRSRPRAVMTQSEGMLPENVVLINANWWGIELDSYSTEAGCWNASQACWDQATTCYNSAPPTGSKNCKIWEDKCTDIKNACNAGTFTGPPNKGVVLTPNVSAGTNTATLPSETAVQSTVTVPTTGYSSSPTGTTLKVSLDATCGGSTGQTCMGSTFGNCCSHVGWCGSNDDYCYHGCQTGFGTCGN
ncbi:hypothetical protein B7494_g4133 [Chlorociboria aeruginascens]|nr:hypothetical protein B7494_g4133 [Chlorociboria aeruginascens]